MAAAIYATGQPAARDVLVEQIGAAYEDESDPPDKGAFALALGLRGCGLHHRPPKGFKVPAFRETPS